MTITDFVTKGRSTARLPSDKNPSKAMLYRIRMDLSVNERPCVATYIWANHYNPARGRPIVTQLQRILVLESLSLVKLARHAAAVLHCPIV
jgi:hypothetical protein